jgi:cardiolipin synthase (CMP-forming)
LMTGPEALDGDRLDRIATVPNLLSLIRILLIPAFVLLLLGDGTEAAGLILLGGVVATDWVDGYIARRTGQVTTLGKILDPVADRLALGAALVTLVVRDAFPLWAALLVLVRDGVIIAVGAMLLFRMGVRLDVRWIGKIATFSLMWGIPLVAWGRFGLWLKGIALPAGWVLFGIGAVLYYVAGIVYAFDVGAAIRATRTRIRRSELSAKEPDGS